MQRRGKCNAAEDALKFLKLEFQGLESKQILTNSWKGSHYLTI